MNFNLRRRDRIEPEVDGPVDLDEQMAETLTERLRSVPPLERPADEFAPQRSAPQRIEEAIEQIESFLALPLKEIDETEAALKAEYEDTMAKGQEIRNIIMVVRKDYLAQIERGRKVASIAKETFATLAQKVAALDAPMTPAPAAPVDQATAIDSVESDAAA